MRSLVSTYLGFFTAHIHVNVDFSKFFIIIIRINIESALSFVIIM